MGATLNKHLKKILKPCSCLHGRECTRSLPARHASWLICHATRGRSWGRTTGYTVSVMIKWMMNWFFLRDSEETKAWYPQERDWRSGGRECRGYTQAWEDRDSTTVESGRWLLLTIWRTLSLTEVHLWNKYWAMTAGEEGSVSSEGACKLSLMHTPSPVPLKWNNGWQQIKTPFSEGEWHPQVLISEEVYLHVRHIWTQDAGKRACLMPRSLSFAACPCRHQWYCQQIS